MFANDLFVWNVGSRHLVAKLPLHSKPGAIALSAKTRTLAAGVGADIELWDLAAVRKASLRLLHKENVWELEVSPDGLTLASACNDNTAALWDIPSGRLKHHLKAHTLAVFRVAFSPDGRTLATRGADDKLKLWNVASGREMLTIDLPKRADSVWGPHYGGVKFSPDGTMLAVGLLSPAQIQIIRVPSPADIQMAERAGP